MTVISPYKSMGFWVFDDEEHGLVKEAFVSGADNMIDIAVQLKNIPDPENGFRLLFSEGPFPEYDFRLDWVRESHGGNWYRSEELGGIEGWLCPALFHYFEEAPKTIHVQFLPK